MIEETRIFSGFLNFPLAILQFMVYNTSVAAGVMEW